VARGRCSSPTTRSCTVAQRLQSGSHLASLADERRAQAPSLPSRSLTTLIGAPALRGARDRRAKSRSRRSGYAPPWQRWRPECPMGARIARRCARCSTLGAPLRVVPAPTLASRRTQRVTDRARCGRGQSSCAGVRCETSGSLSPNLSPVETDSSALGGRNDTTWNRRRTQANSSDVESSWWTFVKALITRRSWVQIPPPPPFAQVRGPASAGLRWLSTLLPSLPPGGSR
jgi:hypothetical protein